MANQLSKDINLHYKTLVNRIDQETIRRMVILVLYSSLDKCMELLHKIESHALKIGKKEEFYTTLLCLMHWTFAFENKITEDINLKQNQHPS